MWRRPNGHVMCTLFSCVAATIFIIIRVHTGMTNTGLNFSEAYSGWRDHIESPFIGHLDKVLSASLILLYINRH